MFGFFQIQQAQIIYFFTEKGGNLRGSFTVNLRFLTLFAWENPKKCETSTKYS
jgi:hypothetical protein